MPIDTEILLCDCSAGFDTTRRFARLDELTLTYDVVQRQGDGEPRVLRRHVASLREARAQACATRTDDVTCPFEPATTETTRRQADDHPAGGSDAAGLETAVAELVALVRGLIAGNAKRGSVVRVADQTGRISDFELTDGSPQDVPHQTVEATSPIGRELLGATHGDWVCLTVSNGRRKRVQVIDVMSGVNPTRRALTGVSHPRVGDGGSATSA
jgi:transcription elongation GreA/GreB family factor